MAEANVILVLALILYMGIASLLRTSWRVTRTFETRRSIIDVVTFKKSTRAFAVDTF